jgi:hypothetical protein
MNHWEDMGSHITLIIIITAIITYTTHLARTKHV